MVSRCTAAHELGQRASFQKRGLPTYVLGLDEGRSAEDGEQRLVQAGHLGDVC